MSQKKKINLNPLPQQTDDYSRYEVTETRWDRIAAVAVLFLGVIALLFYFMLSTPDTSEAVDIQAAEPEQQVSTLNDDVIPPVPATEQVQAEESAVETKLEVLDSVQTQVQSEPAPIKAELIKKPLQNRPVEENLEAKAVASEVKVERQSAVVNITKKSIAKAVLTLELDETKPQEMMPYDLVLSDTGIIKVILFTEMQGLKGKTIFHEWYNNGVRQARVTIPVNRNSQTSYSSKFINAQMLGEWQVKVLDTKDVSYVVADFRVAAP